MSVYKINELLAFSSDGHLWRLLLVPHLIILDSEEQVFSLQGT